MANACSLACEHMFARLMILIVLAALAVGLAARPSGSAGKPATYVVAPRDTLWSIAARHYAGDPREGIWKLQERNHLKGTTIVPGQRLVLP
jgi:LysM repeat protein